MPLVPLLFRSYPLTCICICQSLEAVAKATGLWLPARPSAATQLALKRAVVSCADALLDPSAGGASSVNGLAVEDLVAQAADNAPLAGGEGDVARLQAISLLRRALARLVKEIEPIIKKERDAVKRLGGLYVIGEGKRGLL